MMKLIIFVPLKMSRNKKKCKKKKKLENFLVYSPIYMEMNKFCRWILIKIIYSLEIRACDIYHFVFYF